MISTTRTIAAVATAPGRSAIAIVRVSGPAALSAAKILTRSDALVPRRATLRDLIDPDSGELIDRGLVLWFPAPGSYTGDDMVEFQVHGSRAVTGALLRALVDHCDVELAQAGEFSRRAFDNGKLDLAQAEAVADVIDAETTAQLRQANRQLSGALGASAERWRTELIRASAYFEAAIDFPDEDVPSDVTERARPLLIAVAEEIAHVLADNRAGERLREGLVIALVGPPNAGKSTLLNAIAKRDVAIVSEIPGTTRDAIEVSLDLNGYPVVLVDTAGLRETADPIEREGVRRTHRRAELADLRLVIWDITVPITWRDLGLGANENDILVLSKADLAPAVPQVIDWPGTVVQVSAQAGVGLSALIEELSRKAETMLGAGQGALITRERHRLELQRALDSLRSALAANPHLVELIAEELRIAAHALGRIAGRVDVEDILDVVFAEFCLGK